MNILTIISDEHSYQAMSNAGNMYAETPNLDRLAKISQNFANAYTSCPVCAPARASWFTGQYVCNLGTWDNSTPYDGRVYGIGSWLKKYDIPVYHIGKTHFQFFCFQNRPPPQVWLSLINLGLLHYMRFTRACQIN